MNRILHSLVILSIVLGAVASTACNADPKVLDSAVYAEYHKADILGTVSNRYSYAKVVCTEDGKVRLIMVFDTTMFSVSSATILKEQDIEVPSIVCGQQLTELKRLADTGRQHDKKPGE